MNESSSGNGSAPDEALPSDQDDSAAAGAESPEEGAAAMEDAEDAVVDGDD